MTATKGKKAVGAKDRKASNRWLAEKVERLRTRFVQTVRALDWVEEECEMNSDACEVVYGRAVELALEYARAVLEAEKAGR